ncbi:UbiA family prenyltransferase [Sphingomonas parva]|uniref:UbiA family prenyltransferase n=1 Tax=Sphingomonas parva TaxID=2555898 RepID=UPI001431FD07|nr:UbiA family prenyltransferase [Sphingomonas parva]
MRLPFQLTLAPIFLWGALLSGGRPDWAAAAAFLSLHLFLYPAATAFNAVYDRDEGAVSGLAVPPPVPPHLARVAITLALAGLLLAFPSGPEFVTLYLLIVGWTAAYSHPRTRWKAGPWRSAAAIGLGQGVIGFAAGWAALAPLAPEDPALSLGAASASLTALGLYPVTQVFQVDEDRARGDRTLAVVLGPAGALRLGAACLAAAGMIASFLVSRLFPGPDGLVVGVAYLGLIAWQLRLARTIAGLDEAQGYARAMRLLNAATAGFLLFLAAEAVLS